jgi:hypothetical protein
MKEGLSSEGGDEYALKRDRLMTVTCFVVAAGVQKRTALYLPRAEEQ